ncbi:putative bifunctional diguanylate cyclase/phosphodiesterase [Yoonia sp. R2331]|uniref:putative bifunctional diguanylate cyclase/phosphodiesterase n=1 Tax=Yoonia sp. R2331 TaxID=3237238 RepID=UPI0034E5AF7C
MAEMTAARELISRDVLFHLYDSAPSQLYTFDAASLKLIAANQSARVFLDKTMRDLVGATPWSLMNGLNADRVRRVFARVKERKAAKFDFYLHDVLGSGRVLAFTIMYQRGTKPVFVVMARDITLLNRYKMHAAQAEDRLATAINALSDGFVVYDADDRLVMCNQTYRSMYGPSAAVMTPGTKFEDILRYGLEQKQYAAAIGREDEWLRKRMEQHVKCDVDLEQQLSDGRWLRIVEQATSDGGRVGLRIDITALKDQQARLRNLLRTDDLTGLRNRYKLSEEIDALLETLEPRERIVILHLDLDRFKTVNDVFGHDAGDFVLRTAAEILSGGRVRPRIVARIDGDEFISVLVTRKSRTEVLRYADQISDKLSQPISYDGHLCHVGASMGAAFVNPSATRPGAEALSDADIALGQAKRGEAQDTVLFEPHMRETTLRNSDLAQRMQAGINRGEFVSFFQPQLNARSGRIIGFEALIRWIPSSGDPVPAGEFLSVAQNAGLTEMLDDIVMEQSCRALRKMMNWGLQSPCISLNMSMAQISDTHLIKRLNTCMRKHGLTHQNLRIELLESTLLDERAGFIVENVHRLIDAGFRVELDDFGTGHAAIATLRKFDVSKIKIDRSLVRNIDGDQELQTITRAILDLAQNLGIDVLAEGVETQAEQDMLLRFNCDSAQGYLHAKPMPLADLRSYLEQRGDIAERAPAASGAADQRIA